MNLDGNALIEVLKRRLAAALDAQILAETRALMLERELAQARSEKPPAPPAAT